jgi:nicotinic acid phosphoribosyltransferase
MDNLTFGMGGGMTHGPGRDEFSFSMKATARYDEELGWVNLLKEPKTDSSKKSLSGLAHTALVNGQIETVAGNGFSVFRDTDGWKMYYCDGEREYIPTFDEVRNRART